MDRLRQARWKVEAPDGTFPVGESLNFKHLRLPHVVEPAKEGRL